jgi:hypothetical protein
MFGIDMDRPTRNTLTVRGASGAACRPGPAFRLKVAVASHPEMTMESERKERAMRDVRSASVCAPIAPAGFLMTFAIAAAAVVLLVGPGAGTAHGQANEPTLFVGNNGNLEGSITSMRIEEDGSLSVTDFIVLGTRNSLSEPCPGCNTYTMDITPDGMYLVAGHPSSSSFTRHVSITRVHPDATLELVGLYPISESPLGVAWLNNEYFAVTRTSTTNALNEVRVYRFNRQAESITLVSNNLTGGFTTWLAVDRENQRLYAQRSSPTSAVRAYEFDENGQLTFMQMLETSPTYPLGIGLSPDGLSLYGGGGISNGGNKIVGVRISPDTGTMSLMSASPFTSPGASPKQVVVSDDQQFAIAGHGTDATVRTFVIDPNSGSLTPTGHFFDVGMQGSLGDIATAGGLAFATDNTTAGDGLMGVYSFTLGSQGELIQNGPIVHTQGIAPRAVVPWMTTACPADFNGDGVVNVGDLLILFDAWGKCSDPSACPEDLNGDGVVDVQDLLLLLDAWGKCPAG